MVRINSKLGSLPLIRNIFYLGFSQIINFASPALITPYLFRTVGIENFGMATVAGSLMSLFIIFTEYGFNLTSTKAVSINRDNNDILNELYRKVTSTRLFLVLIGFIILLITVYVIPNFFQHRLLFLLSYTMVVARSFIPTWFFIGLEKGSIVAFVNVFSRLINYVLILLLIINKDDYTYINLCWAFGEMVLGTYCILLLKNKYKITVWIVFNKYEIVQELKDGWHIFLTNVSTATYTNSGLIILSAFANESITGMYAVAEKIMLLMKQVFAIISQATYPYVCKLVQEDTNDRKKLNKFLINELLGCIIIFASLGGITYLLADHMILFFTGKYSADAVILVRQLAFVPLIVSLCLPAYQILIINNFKHSYLTVIGLGAIINIVSNLIFVPIIAAQGTILSILVTEFFVTIGLHFALFYRHPKKRVFFV